MAVIESLAKACTWLAIERQKEAPKRVFIKETGSVSWQNAQDTYPAHAEKLMKYAGNYYLIKPMVIKYTITRYGTLTIYNVFLSKTKWRKAA